MSLYLDINVSSNGIEILEEISAKVQHPLELLTDVADIVYDSIASSLENEISPDRSPWAELSPKTIEARIRKKQTPIKKLNATGKGEKAIDVQIIGDTVKVSYGGNNTGYMEFHRTGTGKMPKRNFIPTVEDIEKNERIVRAMEKFINDIYTLK